MSKLSDWLVAAAAAVLLAMVPTCSQAQTFDVSAAQATYTQFDNACRHGDRKACDDPKFDAVSKALSAAGWLVYPGYVWISIDQLHVFGRFLQTAEAGAQENLWAAYQNRFALLSYLRRDAHVNDAQIAAWWKLNRSTIRDEYPGAWAIMSDILDNMVVAQRALPHYE